jgi:hypothetical protein
MSTLDSDYAAGRPAPTSTNATVPQPLAGRTTGFDNRDSAQKGNELVDRGASAQVFLLAVP